MYQWLFGLSSSEEKKMNYEVGINNNVMKQIDADSFVVAADGLKFYKEAPGAEKVLVAWFRAFDYFVLKDRSRQ